MPRIVIVVCALLMLTLTTSVKADPIVVTSGSLSVTGMTGGPSFGLFGENFAVFGGGEQGSEQAQQCFPCMSGGLIGLNGFFAGGATLGFGGAALTINGTTFTNLILNGTLVFTGVAQPIPAATTNISITAPFTFTGDIAACQFHSGPPDCSPGDAIFTTQLVGQGIATIQLDFLGTLRGNSLYQFNNIVYNFQPAEVPEPMTITLLAAGLMGLGAKWKLAKKRRL